mmetsp:Transcript_10478/g.22392  ORF Transcript_10478/g.22392 Transcript_10478/m.22392 type:complete len:506 (-) Transcript_10478:224-1741(-)
MMKYNLRIFAVYFFFEAAITARGDTSLITMENAELLEQEYKLFRRVRGPSRSPTIADQSKTIAYQPCDQTSSENPCSTPTSAQANSPVTKVVNKLENNILAGYQGWFSYPGDSRIDLNKWKHWFPTGSEPSADNLHVEMYPYMEEYDEDDLKETRMRMKDGRKAKLYSAAKPNIVRKHFEWMAEYGISGVFHMRFMEGIHITKNREWKTSVLRNVKRAAAMTGRLFAVSYNIAGQSLNDGVLDALMEDWKRLVDEEKITQHGRYIRHRKDGVSLPVLRIYGIGFKTVNVRNTEKIAELIDWLKNAPEERYRVFLVGGTPSRWRDLTDDSREEESWTGIYESLDAIHPWHVGRWETIEGFYRYFENVITPDAVHCEHLGILYMPTMFPGFSWYNLKKHSIPAPSMNSIPRLGGKFMWAQAYQYAAAPNITTVWMAQFDEVDEGTAIFKVGANEDEVPADGKWLTLDSDGITLPRDWYLRLCGEAQKMMNGTIPLTEDIPLDPNDFL